MKRLSLLASSLFLFFISFSQYSNPIEFLHSSYGAGYGSKIYYTDEGAGGVTNLRIAVRGGTTAYTDAMVIRAADVNGGGLGNIGIGMAAPTSRVHIQGGSLGSNLGDKINLMTLQNGCGSGGNWSYIDMYSYRSSAGNSWLSASSRIQQTIDGTKMGFLEFNSPNLRNGLSLGTNNLSRLTITDNGNVGINTSTPGSFQLAVEGKIGARGVTVTLANPWPDFVFQNEYPLLSLDKLAAYVALNKHLPGLPSASEVEKNGLDLGNNQAKLVEKIEELTLYTIDLQKQLAAVREENKKMGTLQFQIDELKAMLKK